MSLLTKVTANFVTVRSSIAGFIERNLQSKLEDTISVKDFGAVGDGVTDDTEAFKAALASFTRGTQSLSGGALYIPAAQSDLGYKITDTLVIPDKVNIYGDGYLSAINASGSSIVAGANVVSLDTGPYTTGRFLRNLRIIGNGVCNGLGTTIQPTDTVLRVVYGFDIVGISVQSVDEAFIFQGLWHSTISNCTAAACRIGLHFFGQCVSIHVTGCHMRRTSVSQIANSFGYLINPRTYAYAPGQPRRSEAIIIDGESMAIGFDTGLRLTDGLDMHFSNLDLDYCQSFGVTIADVNGPFTLTDSWIAADAAAAGLFIGIHSTTPPTPSQKRLISGVYIVGSNGNPANNNIGMNFTANNNTWSIRDVTVVGARYSAVFDSCNSALIDGCIFTNTLQYTNSYNFTISNTQLNGITEASKPADTTHHYMNNRGTPATAGNLKVPMAGAATAGSVNIPNGNALLTYFAERLDRNTASSNDKISVSGVTVSVSRATPVGPAIDTWVAYKAI